jgi:circadian clock protein KaiC
MKQARNTPGPNESRGPDAAEQRDPLGIEGLDALLNGGLPEGNSLLVQGAPGTGKTVLALQFLYEGANRLNAPGLLVTFEEPPRRLYRDARSLGWDFERLEQERRLLVVYTSPATFLKELEGGRYKQLVQDYGLRRVVVDSLTIFETLSHTLPDDAIRIRYERIVNALRRDNLTVLMTRELATRDTPNIVTPEEYIADTIIHLDYRTLGDQRTRLVEVLKHRGSAHSPTQHRFAIETGGIHVLSPLTGDYPPNGSTYRP